jgi:hypothetical protein
MGTTRGAFEYYPALGCNTTDNKHLLEEAAPPHYAQCSECGIRFFLIDESIIKETGILVAERPTEAN